MHSVLSYSSRVRSRCTYITLLAILFLAGSGLFAPNSRAAITMTCSSNTGNLLLTTSIRGSQLSVTPCIEKQTLGSLVQYRPVVMWRNTGGLAVDFNSIYIGVNVMAAGTTKYVCPAASMSQPLLGTVNAANSYTYTSVYTGSWVSGRGYVGVEAFTNVDVRDDGAGVMRASASALFSI